MRIIDNDLLMIKTFSFYRSNGFGGGGRNSGRNGNHGLNSYRNMQSTLGSFYQDNNSEMPVGNLIKKVSANYFIVNVNDVFENNILEHYLKTEFNKVKLDQDFEYAIYNCGSDEMMYGNYISASDTEKAKCAKCFTKKAGLVYYFAVRFPQLKYNYIASLNQYWIYTGVLILVLVIYVYSVVLLIKQKKYTELQTDFINNMTHEFKTPISSILIASNYASTQNEIKNNPKLSKYTQIIIEQSNKLNQHIEKILHIAKSDSNSMTLEIAGFNVLETISNARETLLLKYNKEIKIDITTDKSEYIVEGDAFHVSNVIYNIIDNAVKYNDQIPEININITSTTKEIKLAFIDNGIGISSKKISFIFDKFYRVQNEKSNEVNGFGLGLYYVKEICSLQNWKIKAENKS